MSDPDVTVSICDGCGQRMPTPKVPQKPCEHCGCWTRNKSGYCGMCVDLAKRIAKAVYEERE